MGKTSKQSKARRQARKKKRCASPGPGEYERVEMDIVKTAAPEYTIKGRHNGHSMARCEPGPGWYDVRTANVTEGVSMKGKRPATAKVECSPGPAEYQISNARRSDGWTFGMSANNDNEHANHPGPGFYENNASSPTQYGKFGRETRGKETTWCDSPGPANYVHRASWNTDQWTIGKKTNFGLPTNQWAPGPGQYFPEIKGSAPAFSITGKNKRVQMQSECPGPNTYFPSIHSSKPDSKSARFSKGDKYAQNRSCDPGPGAYDSQGTLGGPTHLIAGKYEESKIHWSPGPAEYNISLSNKKRPVSGKIGSEVRMADIRSCYPGPGQYNQKSEMDERSTVFGTAGRSNRREDSCSPGPGAYDLNLIKMPVSPGTQIGTEQRMPYLNRWAPGPGQYDVQLLKIEKGTKFGSEKRPKSARGACVPGPGAYGDDILLLPKVPGITIGTEFRMPKIKNCIPGPANYQNSLPRDKRGAKFGTAQRARTIDRCSSPGPAQYNRNILKKQKGKSVKIGSEARIPNIRNCNPGPGAYKSKDEKEHRGAKIGTSKRPRSAKKWSGPGPGAYGVSILSAPDVKSTKMGTAPRMPDLKDCTPGPGQYKGISTLDSRGTKIGTSKRPKTAKKSCDPGPGAYGKNIFKKTRTTSAKIGTAPRMPKLKDCAPGPGQYNCWIERDERGAKIGTEVRPNTAKQSCEPGPGTYDMNTMLFQKPGKTIAGKRRSQSIDCAPGPGAYNVKSETGIAYSLQGRYGRDAMSKENCQKPAPGAYNPIYDLVLPFSPGKTIAGKRKEASDSCEPGPGSYNYQLDRGLAFSMKGKNWIENTKSCGEPGPNTYNPDYKVVKENQPGKTIAGKRNEKHCEDGPGPGAYLIKFNENGKGWTIAHRPKTSECSTQPGPGAYDLKSTIGDKPGKTIAGKRNEPALCDITPGPGLYNPELDKGIAYSIQGRHFQDHEQNENMKKPGPNTYNPNVDLVHPHHPGKSIGRKPYQKNYDCGPGPGAYRFYDKENEGKGWTIAGRPKTADSVRSPGPAAYEIGTTIFDKPGKTIAGKLETKPQELGPGPGQYNPKLDPGIAYTIQGKYKDNHEANENMSKPGPNSYFPDINPVKPHYPGKSIAGKPNSIEKCDDVPGPGMYNPQLDRGIAYSIQGRHFNDADMNENMKKPGPNSYFPNVDLTHPHHPGKSIGMKYPQQNFDCGPGPGAYKFYDKENEGKGWTIAGRPKSADSIRSPGPAAYDIGTTLWKQPGITIAGRRESRSLEWGPGPGMYNPKLDTGIAYTMQGRYLVPHKMDKPGPNSYYPSVNFVKPNYPGKTIAGRRNTGDNAEIGPGPGMYNPQLDKGIAYSIQGRNFNDADMIENMKKPGPNTYNPNVDLIHPHHPGKSIGMKYQHQTFDSVPGPGEYKFYDNENDGKGWTIAGRPKTVDNFNTPGPDAYNIGTTLWDKPGKTMAGKNEFTPSESGPGPGMYNPKLDRGPAYTIQGRYNNNYEMNENMNKPGPNTYNPSVDYVKPNYPGKTIAGRRTSTGQLDNAPGPGMYDPKLDRGIAYSIQGRNFNDTAMIESMKKPGPSNYDVKTDLTLPHNPGKSMGARHSQKYIDSGPGPGEYKYYDQDGSKGWTIAQKLKSPEGDQTPGPAAYDLGTTIHDKPGKTIAGRNDIKYIDGTPGPGMYNPKVDEGIAYTMQGRYKGQFGDNGMPGPNNYNPNYDTVKPNNPGKSMSGKQSDKMYDGGPGPGMYDPKLDKGPEYTMQGRYQEIFGDNGMPGPNSYQPNYNSVLPSNKGGNMSGKPTDKHHDGGPGPGMYDPKLDKGPEYTMQGKYQGAFGDNGMPGPNNYNPNYNSVRPNSSGQTIAGRPNDQHHDGGPGPGMYDPKLDKGPAYSMQGKSDGMFGDNGMPGPNNYNPNYSHVYPDNKSANMAGKPMDRYVDGGPGPGMYNPKLDKGPEYSMQGKSGTMFGDNGMPGPNNYNPNYSHVYPDSKGANMASKPLDKHIDGGPGPGMYNPKLDKGPEYSMQGKGDGVFGDNGMPGPNNYNPNYNAVKPNNSGQTIAGKPTDKHVNSGPGPGMYDPKLDKGPAFSMQGKGDNMFGDNGMPGPNNYNPNYDAVNPNNKGQTIAGKPYEKHVDGGPGPGMYNPKLDNGQAFTMQGKGDDMFGDNGMPGPNNYNPNYNAVNPNSKGGNMAGKPMDKKIDDVPGPGMYKPKTEVGPAFTMQGKGDDMFGDNGMPGPNNYNPNYKSVNPNSKGGNMAGKPMDRKADDVPGPGMYKPKTEVGPAFTMQGKGDDMFGDNGMPGPNNYNPNYNSVNPNSKGGNMAGKPMDRKADDVPGPGMYKSKNEVGPAFTMQGKGDDMFGDNGMPGPNNYNPNYNSVNPNSKGGNMAGKPMDKKPDDVPGPGMYKPKTEVGPAFTMQGKGDDMFGDNGMPGPNNYNPNYNAVNPNSKGGNMAGKPMDKKADDVPGPGMYKPKTEVGQAFTMQGKGDDMFGDNGMPGPNNYNPNYNAVNPNNTGQTIAGKPSEKIIDKGPGPGMYDPKLEKGIAYSMQGRYGHDQNMLESMKKPGPIYDPRYEAIRPDNTSANMAGRPNDKRVDDTPGPGNYKYNDHLGEGKGYTMAHRPNTIEGDRSPGPAGYYPSVRTNAPAYTMSGSRKPYNDELSPGPQYDVNVPWDNGTLFGHEEKFKGTNTGAQPGPGQYGAQTSFDGKGRAVYMAGKYPDRAPADVPGPGAYDSRYNNPGPKYSLSSSRKEDKVNPNPGPAEYDLSRSGNVVYSGNNANRFGTGTRQESSKQDTPGPGNYHYNPKNTGGATMAARYPERENWRSPGPATYDQNWESIQNKTNNQNYNSMTGTGHGDFYHKNDNPGPGTYKQPEYHSKTGSKMGIGSRTESESNYSPGSGKYYSPPKHNTRSAFIGTDKRDKKYDTGTPGPGQYHIPSTVADLPKYALPNQSERYKYI